MFNLTNKIEEFSLHKRILIITTFYAVILCVISAFLNFNLHYILVIVPVISAVIFAFLFQLAKQSEAVSAISTSFIIVCLIALSIVWFYNDGYNSSHSLLIFNTIMISIMISPKSRRLTVFIIFAVILSTLIIIQYLYPELFNPYESEFIRFLDILPSTILNLIIMFGLINYVLNNYDIEQNKVIIERKRVEEVNSELQEKNNLISEQINKLDILNKELNNVNSHISKQYKELENLNSIQASLNEEITSQNNKLNKLNSDLLEANLTKDKFFSIIAHDLKNPLTAILLKSELVYNYFDRLSDDERIEHIRTLHYSSKHLYQFLENLLTWARSQTGKIEFLPKEISFKKVIDEILELLKQSLTDKKISITLINIDNVHFVADYNMLSAIMRNLISNAIKFSFVGGEIEIGVKENNLSDSENSDIKKNLTIYVKDNGIGMSKSKIERIFNIGDTVSTKGTIGEIGTGLGLILCQEFAVKHNWSISVDSIEGKGSTFSFVIQS